MVQLQLSIHIKDGIADIQCFKLKREDATGEEDEFITTIEDAIKEVFEELSGVAVTPIV